MVYMNERDFDMWEFALAEEKVRDQGWFAVDEVIAPVIQELNRRGYRTSYCCSGHPISGLTPTYIVNSKTQEVIRCEYVEYCQPTLYIAFDRDYGFGYSEPIPAAFYMDDENTVLRLEYETLSGFSLLHERLDACEQLYAWAKTLPIIAANRMLPSGSAA